MLRIFQATLNTPANAMYKAVEAMKTGMAVTENYAGRTVGLPEEESGVNLLFVDKERMPTGLNAGRGDMSDYDPNFTEIGEDEPVKVIAFQQGDIFGTDQYTDAELETGDMLAAGVDGRLKKAESDTESVYRYTGTYNDNGHTLARVAVLHTAAKNA